MAGKRKVGIVVSDKMNQTIVINVENRYKHPIYKKPIVKNKRYMVHDPKNLCNVGDIVSIIETRPLSKKKRWKLNEIIRKVKIVSV